MAKGKKYTSIELFAGAGGLALGLEQAGFDHIGLVEINHDACETLRTNRPKWKVVEDDIAIVASGDLEKEFNIKKKELDLLSGGAPCQSFSYAGKRLGLEDTRGTMFYHYATFLNKLQPKMFIFENVRGLLNHDKGRTYQTILGVFEECGYITYHKVLNAWDYGCPQKRERLITIGIRKDLLKDIPEYEFPKAHDYKPVIRDIKLDKNPPREDCEKYSERKKKIFDLVPPGGYWRDIDPEIAKEWMGGSWYLGGGKTGILRRIGLDEPSLAVLTSPGMKQTERCHPLETRPFSYRENARIQTFPDEWIFCGKLTEKYKQVGNAVPVNLAKDIGISIIKYLGKLTSSKKKTREGNYMYNLRFIDKDAFEYHVRSTIEQYFRSLESYNLEKFNSNVVDPIKLLFDKNVKGISFEEVVEDEIRRQKDKTDSNIIGYFHQNIFQYIDRCEVPQYVWDVIYHGDKTYYVEMKNKHNTMNSSSSQKTYMKLQNQALKDPNCIACLVEVIAKKSQDIPWNCKVDGVNLEQENVRRISIDQFYKIVTGIDNAFFQICQTLPETIKSLISNNNIRKPNDTVLQELKQRDPDILKSLYLLAFDTYLGFDELMR